MILFLILVCFIQGCEKPLPDRFVIPQSLTTAKKCPIILDYMWLSGCSECQILDAARWLRRQNDLTKRGAGHEVEIICILASDRPLNTDLIEQQTSSSMQTPNVHYVYTVSEIRHFLRLNPAMPSRRSFTCLLDPEGSVVCQGGDPKKDMESFDEYVACIHNLNI